MYLAGNYCDSDNGSASPPLISAQAFIFLSGILSGIDVKSGEKAAYKPFISRFFGGSIPSLGTTTLSKLVIPTVVTRVRYVSTTKLQTLIDY